MPRGKPNPKDLPPVSSGEERFPIIPTEDDRIRSEVAATVALANSGGGSAVEVSAEKHPTLRCEQHGMAFTKQIDESWGCQMCDTVEDDRVSPPPIGPVKELPTIVLTEAPPPPIELCVPGEAKVDVVNYFGVKSTPTGREIYILRVLPGRLDQVEALNFAAHIVARIDPTGLEFPKYLEAVKKSI